MQLGTWMIRDRLHRWCSRLKQREQSKTFFKYFYDEYDMLLDFYLRTNHIQSFLQDKVELVKHHTVFQLAGGRERLRNFRVPSQIDFNWNKIKLNPNLCMDDFLEQYPAKALDDGHPGLKTHKEFATAIYNEIKNENPEKFN